MLGWSARSCFAIKAVQTTRVNRKTTVSVMLSTQSKSCSLKPTALQLWPFIVYSLNPKRWADKYLISAVMWKRQETMSAAVWRLTSPNEFLEKFCIPSWYAWRHGHFWKPVCTPAGIISCFYWVMGRSQKARKAV